MLAAVKLPVVGIRVAGVIFSARLTRERQRLEAMSGQAREGVIPLALGVIPLALGRAREWKTLLPAPKD